MWTVVPLAVVYYFVPASDGQSLSQSTLIESSSITKFNSEREGKRISKDHSFIGTAIGATSVSDIFSRIVSNPDEVGN